MASATKLPVRPTEGDSPTNATSATLITPPELEQTLSMLSSHRTVLGYLLLSCTTPVKIIRHSGVVFEGEPGRRYAVAVSKIVEVVRSGLESVGENDSDTDEVRFMRIRTKRHELMISPDERYLLAVLHDPATYTIALIGVCKVFMNMCPALDAIKCIENTWSTGISIMGNLSS